MKQQSTTTPVRAAGYARVSTEEQAREGYGLDAQRSAITAYCKAQGWELVDVFVDAGISGKSVDKREALARLIAAADARMFDRVVFWKLDRLSRSLRDVLDLSDRFQRAGVEIVSIQEGIDAGTPTGRLYRNILGTLAEFERETITERIREALAEKARQGELLGPLPLGYVRNEAGELEVDERTAEFIRASYERYATGQYSLREMASWARGWGVRTTRGNPIDRLNMRKVLQNISYTGAVGYRRRDGGETLVEDAHPAIVSRALFDRVQAALERRRRADIGPRPRFGKEPYPMSAIARCADCRAPMSGSAAGSPPRRYMRCSTAARNGRAACVQPMVQATLLEAQLGAYVSTMELENGHVEQVTESISRRQAAEPTEIRALKQEIERWRRLFVLGEIDEARYRVETQPLLSALQWSERAGETIDYAESVSYLRNVGGLFLDCPMGEQRRFVQEVFEHLEVQGAQLREIRPRQQYAALFAADRDARFSGEQCVLWLPGQDSNLQPIG